MSNRFALSDIRDPLAFLTGARVPLTLATPMATWQRYEWIADRLLVRLCSDRAWIERDEKIDWNLYLMDLSDPDVARWCDWKIAEIYQHLPRYADDIVANFRGAVQWSIGVVGYPIVDANQWRLRYNDGLHGGGWLILRHDRLSNIPCLASNVPTARAALLRALFGVSNA